MECLEIARRMYDLTGGAFDVSIGSGLDRLELDPDELTVHARRGGARLDLGGIGKGYAVDRMAEVLEEWEIPHALVHGGFSSVLALEAPPDRDGWPLTLSAPGTRRRPGPGPGLGAPEGLQRVGHAEGRPHPATRAPAGRRANERPGWRSLPRAAAVEGPERRGLARSRRRSRRPSRPRS